jgi:hypothetical protein
MGPAGWPLCRSDGKQKIGTVADNGRAFIRRSNRSLTRAALLERRVFDRAARVSERFLGGDPTAALRELTFP